MLKVRLVLRSGKKKGRRVPVKSGTFYLGRHNTCNLRLKDTLISRWHCVFLQDEEQVVVTDLGSQNGTYVNGHRLNEGDSCRLQHHDTLLVGESEFRVSVRDAESGKGLIFRDPGSKIDLVTLSPEQKTSVAPKKTTPQAQNFDASKMSSMDAGELLRELEDMVGRPEGREAVDEFADDSVLDPAALSGEAIDPVDLSGLSNTSDPTLSMASPVLDTEPVGLSDKAAKLVKQEKEKAAPSPAEIAAKLLRAAGEDE